MNLLATATAMEPVVIMADQGEGAFGVVLNFGPLHRQLSIVVSKTGYALLQSYCCGATVASQRGVVCSSCRQKMPIVEDFGISLWCAPERIRPVLESWLHGACGYFYGSFHADQLATMLSFGPASLAMGFQRDEEGRTLNPVHMRKLYPEDSATLQS